MTATGGSADGPPLPEGIPRRLWRRVALARHRLLMLDYDGTLAPFHAARERALPLPRTCELLRAIAAEPQTAVAIVSGRPIGELEHLLGSLPVTLVGEHGWEERAPGGVAVRHPLPRRLAEMLDRAERTAREGGMGERLERKRTGLVLHTRGFPRARAAELEDRAEVLWRSLAQTGEFSLERSDGGIELRGRSRNKGTAVRSLRSQAPPGTLVVFVGDDVTDEDAFEVVREHGLGVRVGSGDRGTVATARLATCASVPEFLEEWLRVVRGYPTVAHG